MVSVSIIVPIYNTREYLPRCLNSLLNQTLEDIEIIAVDDGSTDGSSEIVDKYALESSKIRVFHLENRGVSSARNFGLKQARGEYIGFVDSDDYVSHSMYSILFSIATGECSDISQCDFSPKVDDSSCFVGKKTFIGTKEIVDGFLNDEISNSVCSKLFSRKIISELLFSEDLIFAEDFEFTAKSLLKAKKVSCVKEQLYFYTTDRLDSQTHRGINPKQLMGFRVYDMLAENLESSGLEADLLHKKELSESLRFFDSVIGHRNIPKDCRKALLFRIRKNWRMYWNNPYLSHLAAFRCLLVAFAPHLYFLCVFVLKFITGRLSDV